MAEIRKHEGEDISEPITKKLKTENTHRSPIMTPTKKQRLIVQQEGDKQIILEVNNDEDISNDNEDIYVKDIKSKEMIIKGIELEAQDEEHVEIEIEINDTSENATEKSEFKQYVKISEKGKSRRAARQNRKPSKRSITRQPKKRGRKPKFLKSQKEVKKPVQLTNYERPRRTNCRLPARLRPIPDLFVPAPLPHLRKILPKVEPNEREQINTLDKAENQKNKKIDQSKKVKFQSEQLDMKQNQIMKTSPSQMPIIFSIQPISNSGQTVIEPKPKMQPRGKILTSKSNSKGIDRLPAIKQEKIDESNLQFAPNTTQVIMLPAGVKIPQQGLQIVKAPQQGFMSPGTIYRFAPPPVPVIKQEPKYRPLMPRQVIPAPEQGTDVNNTLSNAGSYKPEAHIHEEEDGMESGFKRLHTVKKFKETGEIPSYLSKRRIQNLRDYAACFLLINGVLYYIGTHKNEKRLVIMTSELRDQVLGESHDDPGGSGHHGIRNTMNKVSKTYYWRTMAMDVDHWVKSCPVCQKKTPKKIKKDSTYGPKIETAEEYARKMHAIEMYHRTQNIPAEFLVRSKKQGFQRYAQSFDIIDDVFCFVGPKGDEKRVVLPTLSVQRQVFCKCHMDPATGCHHTMEKTLKKIRGNYFFKKLQSKVMNWVKECTQCQRSNLKVQNSDDFLEANQGTLEVNAPWDTVNIEVLGPLPKTLKGNSYVCVIMDVFTHWIIATAMPDKSGASIAATLTETMYRNGPPKRFINNQEEDLGTQITKDICSLFGVDLPVLNYYHPQFEEQHKKIISSLSQIASNNPHNWDEYLLSTTYAINTTSATTSDSNNSESSGNNPESSVTTASPFSMMYNRSPHQTAGTISTIIRNKGNDSNEQDNFYVKMEEATQLQDKVLCAINSNLEEQHHPEEQLQQDQLQLHPEHLQLQQEQIQLQPTTTAELQLQQEQIQLQPTTTTAELQLQQKQHHLQPQQQQSEHHQQQVLWKNVKVLDKKDSMIRSDKIVSRKSCIKLPNERNERDDRVMQQVVVDW